MCPQILDGTGEVGNGLSSLGQPDKRALVGADALGERAYPLRHLGPELDQHPGDRSVDLGSDLCACV